MFIYYLLRFGERGEGVNTPGCEPGMREFDSHRSPQTVKKSPKKYGDFYFILVKYN